MTSAAKNQDQKHPQEKGDRAIVNRLKQGEPNDYNLAELARLRIRYGNFPGARDIKRDLELILNQWGLTEDQLYEKTCQIHGTGQVYKSRLTEEEQQDWS
ncbi:MAG: DUF3288 family protein [Xenococcaceae cyanobacterium]